MASIEHARPIGIGIVTFNNLPLLEKCFHSWRKPEESKLMIFDNGSQGEVVAWLKRQHIDHLVLARQNMGLGYARNRIIEYFRDRQNVDFILLADSDVLFHDGMIEEMYAVMKADPTVGFVGYPQANAGYPCSPEGYVEEIANECQLTRLRMWREIGLFPEDVQYYCADSWKSTIANMHGWRTVVISGKQGYDHFKHGSHVNPGVREAMVRDARRWAEKEAEFVRYWRQRLLLGKGENFRQVVINSDSDENIGNIDSEPPFPGVELLAPDNGGFRFTPKRDVETVVWMSKRVSGNILEIGCHEGVTTMQLAFNNPEKTIYAIDYTGPRPTLRPEQMNEQPNESQFGRYAKILRNVCLINQRFDKVQMNDLDNVEFVFYDADLTYEGVKSATETMLAYFAARPCGHSRFIVWHDYVPKRHISNHPHWLRLGEYIRRELSHRYRIQYLFGTDLACLTYPPNNIPSCRPTEDSGTSVTSDVE